MDMIQALSDKNVIVHFILLCETFLNSSNKTQYNIEGCDVVHQLRDSTSAGGIAEYILDFLRLGRPLEVAKWHIFLLGSVEGKIPLNFGAKHYVINDLMKRNLSPYLLKFMMGSTRRL